MCYLINILEIFVNNMQYLQVFSQKEVSVDFL